MGEPSTALSAACSQQQRAVLRGGESAVCWGVQGCSVTWAVPVAGVAQRLWDLTMQVLAWLEENEAEFC